MATSPRSSAVAKSLVGKPVAWEDTWCPKHGYIARQGVLLELKGKNVLMRENGSSDWKWLDNLHNLRPLVESDAQPARVP